MRVAVGVDIGSLTAKTVVMNSDGRIVSYRVIQGTIVDEAAAVASLQQALEAAHLTEGEIGFLVTTERRYDQCLFGLLGHFAPFLLRRAASVSFVDKDIEIGLRIIIDC